MKQKVTSNQHGFTMIELLIATTVFSVILLVAAATLIQVGRLYYKGIITSKTQNIARSVMDDVSRSIQFSSGNPTKVNPVGSPPIGYYCFGDTRFTFALGQQLDTGMTSGHNASENKMRHVLWQDKIGANNCSIGVPDLLAANPGGTNGRELLEHNMRLQTFDVSPQPSATDIFNVNVKVIYYAGSDLLDNVSNPTTCKGSAVGGQWCAISDLKSVVYSRIK